MLRSRLFALRLLSALPVVALPAGPASAGPSLPGHYLASTLPTCTADDAAGFTACIDKLNGGLTDDVQLTNLVICSGPAACDFPAVRVSRPVSVGGATNSGAGFRRLDTFNYPIVKIQNSTGVTLKNLQFDENREHDCDPTVEDCSSSVSITDDSNIVVDGVTIQYAKSFGIAVTGTKGLTIKNSTLVDHEIFGIWLNNNPPHVPTDVHLENNLLKDTKSNGVLFSAAGTAKNPATITGNTFIHDHRDAVFFVCGPSGRGPCAGGQLLISRYTQNLTISDNVIKEGIMDNYDSQGLFVSGIEFSEHDVSGVTITKNDIHKNTGTGIVVNSPQTNISNISIDQNKLYANRDAIYFPGADIGHNCYAPKCSPTILRGSMYSYPPCIIPAGATTCTTTVTWTTNDASKDAAVKTSSGATFATGTGGSKVSGPIGAAGETFKLYAGPTLLSTLFVKGVTPK